MDLSLIYTSIVILLFIIIISFFYFKYKEKFICSVNGKKKAQFDIRKKVEKKDIKKI